MYLLQTTGDFSWISLLGVGVLIILCLIVIVIIFLKFVLPKKNRKTNRFRRKKLETKLQTDITEIEKKYELEHQLIEESIIIIKSLDDRFEKLEQIISDNEKKVIEVYKKLDSNNKLTMDAFKQSLRNNIYNENIPILDRLIAFKRYILFGGNGNTLRYVKNNLILTNKELWQSVVDYKDGFDNKDSEYYQNYLNILEELKTL